MSLKYILKKSYDYFTFISIARSEGYKDTEILEFIKKLNKEIPF